jgi:hypothetical protein
MFVVLLMVMAAGACDSSPRLLPDVRDEEILLQASTWPNALGLRADDTDLWRQRLGRACSSGVWSHDVAIALGAEFMAEDESAGRSIRAAGYEQPTAEQAGQALWLIAVNVCRDQFPRGSIEIGPPTPPLGSTRPGSA